MLAGDRTLVFQTRSHLSDYLTLPDTTPYDLKHTKYLK